VSESARPTVTGAVLALDEARNVAACLSSLAWTDALLVVLDDRTTDDTATIAERHGARVVVRRFRDYASQRNAALDAVTTDWVFFLDADERVPAPLAAEMRGLVDSPARDVGGYWVPRHNIIWGRRIDHGGWYPDYQLRLLRVAGARYDETREVHELVSVAGETGRLLNPLVHYNYATVRQFLEKQEHYSTLEASSRFRRGESVRAYQLLRKPQREFFRRYFELQGRLDGLHGLMLCGLLAWYELVTLVKLIALRRRAAGASAGG
jgi:glycosyltransferase involved in cell wall biosynthesis